MVENQSSALRGIYATAIASVVVIAIAIGVILFMRGRQEQQRAAAVPSGTLATSSESAPEFIGTTPTSWEDANQGIVILDGATGVGYSEGAYESYHVSYYLMEDYPADAALQELSSSLSRLGWRPLKEDWHNPGTESSHVRGWGEYVDGTLTPDRRIRSWIGQWTNDQGDIVDYSLQYQWPEGATPDTKSLYVSGGWYSAEAATYLQPLRP